MLPKIRDPMAATQIAKPFHRSGWVYEEKYDGWRMVAYKDGTAVRLVSRAGKDHDRRFAELAAAIRALPVMTGLTSAIVQSLGGWKSDAMMRWYAAITDGTLRRAAEAVAGNREWQQGPNPVPALAGR
jgi:hypothetical protein